VADCSRRGLEKHGMEFAGRLAPFIESSASLRPRIAGNVAPNSDDRVPDCQAGHSELNLKIKSAIWHYVCLRSKELLRNDMWFGADLLRDARLVPGREPMTQQQRIIKCPRKSFPRLSGKSSGSINVRIFQKNDPVSLRASYSIESGSLSELLNPASLSRVTATTSNWFHQIFNCMDCGTNVVLALRTWIATTTLAGLLKGLQTILKGEHHVS
jgi:hypothetical protein